MRLARLLFTQGFGTRRECAALVRGGGVTIAGDRIVDPEHDVVDPARGFTVDGQSWPCVERAVVLLNKPAGFECSLKPRHHPGVLSLLPPPLRVRGVQPVGRLDVDTTGLLLLTDDGALSHRLTSPRHHVSKVYDVTTRHPVTREQIERLLAGVVLDDDPRPVAALRCEGTHERGLQMTLEQGRYHQVKRMLAAVGNRVDALHRSAFGAWTLPADLPAGAWCWTSTPTPSPNND